MASQLTLNFEPGLAERHATALDCVRQGAYSNIKPLKTLAADMDMSLSELSRKLSDNKDDPRNFTLHDFENYVQKSGDVTPVYYLIEKYLQDEKAKQDRALQQLAQSLPGVLAMIKQVMPRESA